MFAELEKMPTAYDVDKVVEQMDKASDYYECEEQGREHVQMVDLTEAIEIIKGIDEVRGNLPENGNDIEIALMMAKDALEEIQQYWAFEERLKKIYGDCPGLLETVIKHLEAHEGVDLPESIFKARLLTDGEVDKWEAYKQLGTVEELREAREKQRAKKPYIWGVYDMYECPGCGENYEIDGEEYDYCPNCGQAINWEVADD